MVRDYPLSDDCGSGESINVIDEVLLSEGFHFFIHFPPSFFPDLIESLELRWLKARRRNIGILILLLIVLDAFHLGLSQRFSCNSS